MVNILIADDHDLVRETVAAYLSRQADFVVKSVSCLPDALTILDQDEPIDLAILDFKMPGMDGLSGLQKALARHPSVKFTLMSGLASPEQAQRAMELGARGFFPKSLSADVMVSAIRLVLSGEQYFPFTMSTDTLSENWPDGYRGLSQRETETLIQLCQGKSNKEIAFELQVQEVTVKLHVKNILAKLKVRNRTQAALIAREDGFC